MEVVALNAHVTAIGADGHIWDRHFAAECPIGAVKPKRIPCLKVQRVPWLPLDVDAAFRPCRFLQPLSFGFFLSNGFKPLLPCLFLAFAL